VTEHEHGDGPPRDDEDDRFLEAQEHKGYGEDEGERDGSLEDEKEDGS
jgi:hypothetical protein